MPTIHTFNPKCNNTTPVFNFHINHPTNHNIRLFNSIVFNINGQQSVFDTFREMKSFLGMIGVSSPDNTYTLYLAQRDGQVFDVGYFEIDKGIGFFAFDVDYPNISPPQLYNLEIGKGGVFAISTEFTISNL